MTSPLAEMAHLLRRAGFGEPLATVRAWCALGYAGAVDRLISDARTPAGDGDLLARFLPATAGAQQPAHAAPDWVWRMLTAPEILRERISLFWHSLLAVGSKFPMHARAQLAQIDMFREYGLGDLETLLVKVSQDPAMIVWLDNHDNRRSAPNENYGRELLELFTLGRGHYGEDDIKAAARAFTGWQLKPMISYFPWGPVEPEFCFNPDDHDGGVKTFLGHTGRFGGEDIIAILADHPRTAEFICQRLYRCFVADTITPDGQALLDELVGVFRATGGTIAEVLRAIFMSAHFRSPPVRYARVKSPVELVIGFGRVLGRWSLPDHTVTALAGDLELMGQTLLHPPSVAGWPQGEDWIDGAGLLERIRHCLGQLSTPDSPAAGVLLAQVASDGPRLAGADLVDACLAAFGAIEVGPATRQALIDHVTVDGPVDFATDPATARQRTLELAQAVVATPDFQYC